MAAVLALPWQGLAVVTGVVILAGLWEWTALAGWSHQPARRALYLLACAAALVGIGMASSDWHRIIIAIGVVWWLGAFSYVIAYQRDAVEPGQWPPAVWAILGVFVVIPAWCALMAIHRYPEDGPGLVLVLMVMIWMADIGAYFAGRRFGQRKLASRVSPGKSWEGVAGGAVAALAAAGLYLIFVPWAPVLAFVGLAAVTVVVSVMGDLTESLFKRISGNKDSGSLLPGHGGVLDRIDSLTAAAPFFALGLIVLEAGT